MSYYPGKKFFVIHPNDGGSEAYRNEYVAWLEEKLAAAEIAAAKHDGEWIVQEGLQAQLAAAQARCANSANALQDQNNRLRQQLAAAQAWVADLQSGMYVNCVYCGHRYGPREDTPVSMADVLKEHIEQCPHHPMSDLKQRLATAEIRCEKLQSAVDSVWILIDESRGVDGLHLNGDVALWSDLLMGGECEGWLKDLSLAGRPAGGGE